MIYKVSYVVTDGSLPGGIKNEAERPIVGKVVHEIMPARGDFLYLHATIEPMREEEAEA